MYTPPLIFLIPSLRRRLPEYSYWVREALYALSPVPTPTGVLGESLVEIEFGTF